MPGMTWEKLQRLMDLDAGNDAQRDAFTYQALEIVGAIEDGRAELEIVLRAAVQPTEGKWISIPLKMGNFHQVPPYGVTGVDQYNIQMLPEGEGYDLRVKTDAVANVVLRMRMTARVDKGAISQSIEFRLPDVPSKVELTTDLKNAIGEVMGRGDETTVRQVGEDDRTKFLIESSGGNFFARWGQATSAIESQLLEAQSNVTVNWTSIQSQPIMSVQTTLQSLRGSIDRIQVRFPPGTDMLKAPRLGATGQSLESTVTTNDKRGAVHEIIIPENERRQKIDISYEVQLNKKQASSREPLLLKIPEVVGSLRHSGALEVRTGADVRLRWRSRSWIQTEPSRDSGAGEATRSYRFRYDRVTSDFPIWLARKVSQLRMATHSVITIQDSIASLDMTIRAGGQLPEGNLLLDEASWQLESIENLQTERPLDSSIADFVRVIEVESSDDSNPAPIRIRANFPLDMEGDRVELPLPRIVDLTDASLVQNATVDIVNTGRSILVVDLQATRDLRRTSVTSGNSKGDRLTSHFQVLDLESPVVIVGTLVDQPPQITLSGKAEVKLDGRQLHTKFDWEISSRTDLEGRLQVRIPKRLADPAPLNADSNEAGQELIDDDGFLLGVRWNEPVTRSVAKSSPWIVMVDDVPATLRPLDDDQYELVSDRLTSGSMKICWQNVLTLDNEHETGSISSFSLPRPNVTDVTLRGTIDVDLKGNQRFDVVPIDAPGSSMLQLDSLPRDPVLLRLNARSTSREELSILQSILTTVVGRQTRHEQILARIQRGDQLRIELPKTFTQQSIKEMSVKGYVDDKSVTVRHDRNMLVMTLPGDEHPHNVDLRVWFPKETASSYAMVEPTLKLPPGSGRMFWQIVAPADGHIVWTTPTLGRSMTWRFDQWNLYRRPTHSMAQLSNLVPSIPNPMPTGNRYLYVGSDIPSFQVLIISQALIWLIVGTVVLFASGLLVHVRALRHPLTVIVIAILFAGLLVVAPDAAVLAGQLGVVSSVLVIVMITIRALLTPTRSDRVFTSVDPRYPQKQDRGDSSDTTSVRPSPQLPVAQTVSAPTEASS